MENRVLNPYFQGFCPVYRLNCKKVTKILKKIKKIVKNEKCDASRFDFTKIYVNMLISEILPEQLQTRPLYYKKRRLFMKGNGHKHKESYSILFISNIGNTGRKFYISGLAFRVLVSLFAVICAAVVVMCGIMFRFLYADGLSQSRSKELEKQVAALETEKAGLNDEIAALKNENEALRVEAENIEEEVKEEAQAEAEADSDSYIPRRYPSSGISAVIETFSEEQPYLSINTHTEGNIIATGNGTVTTVTSDDTYPIIIEVEHNKGYKSRYMCRQNADVQATEGAQVEAGDTLFTITTDDTRLDYQIYFEENPIDPLTVIEAKG